MKIFRLVLCLLVVGFGVGCRDNNSQNPVVEQGTAIRLIGGGNAIEFNLSDGTRCVAYQDWGYKSAVGGLTCDWK